MRSITIKRIQMQSKLISATGTFSNQIDLSRKRSFWGIPLGSQALTYQAIGQVSFGYDLSKLSAQSVVIDERGAIAITLPPLEIISVIIDPQQSRPLSTQSVPPEMLQEALQAGDASFRAIACATDAPSKAREQAQADIKNWLSVLQAKDIEITVSEQPGGVCSGAIALEQMNLIEYAEPKLGDPIGDLIVTSQWGKRTFQGETDFHYGLDLALPNGQDATGTPLYAIGMPGEIIEILCWWEPMAGLNISFSSAALGYGFDYGHAESCLGKTEAEIKLAEYSTTVSAGDQIGTIGNTGSSTTGAHLHMQQRKGGATNPLTGTNEPVSKTFAEIATTGKLAP